MQLFYFPGLSHSFHPSSAAMLTRISYLLADTTLLAPETHFLMDFAFTARDLPFSKKIEAVINHINGTSPEHAAVMRGHAETYRQMRALKRKDKMALVIIKQFENLVEQQFKDYVTTLNKTFADYGLAQLQEIIYEDAMHYCDFGFNRAESPKDRELNVSDILQLKGDDPEQPDGGPPIEDRAFLLPAEFLTTDAPPMNRLRSIEKAFEEDAEADDAQILWAEPLLTLSTGIQAMNATELRAVRQELHTPGSAFRRAADEWIAGGYHNQRSPRESARFVADTLKPATAPLQEAIAQNKILGAHRLATSGTATDDMQLFAAEMPLNAVWAFYERAKGLEEETLQKLRAVWDTAGARRFPMFILNMPLTKTNPNTGENTAAPEGEIPTSIRKRIDL